MRYVTGDVLANHLMCCLGLTGSDAVSLSGSQGQCSEEPSMMGKDKNRLLNALLLSEAS